LEEATALAIKRVLAWEFEQAMKKANVSTISKAATALGKSLRLKLAA
jgi:hypothetical protein